MTKSILSLLLLLAVGSAHAQGRPNVILIVTDDQGYGDMSCHGNPWLRTPSLDRLCAESVRLEDYHVDPVCTPTRAALMTGRYSSRVGAWAVTEGRQLLKADEVTMGDVFSDSGYRTAMFGKWHLGDTWPYAPRYRGFQEVVRHLAGGIVEIGNPIGNDFFDDTYYRNGVPEKINGYCTDVFFAECQRFITQSSSKPFFVYLPLNAMHGPHTVAEKYSAPFKADGHGDVRAKFFGQIINFDENLRRLLDCLETSKLAENTIVIFMGDNGTAAGAGGRGAEAGFNAGMRGRKGSVYEGGHRVACFVRWPAQLNAGQQIEQLTSCRDWLPSLIEWCRLEPPKCVRLDGRSLQPLMVENVESWPDRTLFVERQGDHPSLEQSTDARARYPHFAVLTEKWRLVDGGLFNIVDDPGQRKNVAAEHANIARDLRSQYERFFADVYSGNGAYTRFQLGANEENPTLLTVRDWHPTEGNVIWKQGQLGDDTLTINGFWAVNVVHAGRYSIRLSRFPDDAPQAMRATKAVLKIGEQRVERELLENETSVTFELDLPEGPGLLQSWLSDEQAGVRGAYFVSVNLSDVAKQDSRVQQTTSTNLHAVRIPRQANQFVHVYKPAGDHFFGPDTHSLKEGQWYDIWVPNDHTFVRDEDGKWHIIGITHPYVNPDPAFGGIHQGEYASFHAVSSGDDFESSLKEHHYSELPKILPPKERPGEPPANHAPCIVRKDGLYRMVYGPSPIRLAVSKDLSKWELKGELFSQEGGARDPNLLLHNGTYYISYCSERSVLTRTSEDLVSWSEPETIFTANSFDPESPSLVFYNDTFYLFVCSWDGVWDHKEVQGAYQHKTNVYQSDNLSDFGIGDEKQITTLNSHAPEIFEDENGQWYISSVEWPNRGVSVDKLFWENSK